MTEAPHDLSKLLGEPIGKRSCSGRAQGDSYEAIFRLNQGRRMSDAIIATALAVTDRKPVWVSTNTPGEFMLFAQPPITVAEDAVHLGAAIDDSLKLWQPKAHPNSLTPREMDVFTPRKK